MSLYRHLLVALILAVAVSCVLADEREVLRVNDFWNNHITMANDHLVHGKDHWQTPAETWRRRTGDCDDYAVAKYYTLLALGVPHSQLKLANVVLDGAPTPSLHVVVFYLDNRGTWVLDNLAPDPMLLKDRKDILGTLAIYHDKGTAWMMKRPVKTTTPEQWDAMRHKEKTHRQVALAAFNTGR